MKTAVSIPDPLFREAEAAAKKLSLSRSRFIQIALEAYLQRRREEDAEGGDHDSGKYYIEPERHGSARSSHRQTYAEKPKPNKKSDGDRQDCETCENKATGAKVHSR